MSATGNVKIWWREDDGFNLDIGRSHFEVQDTNMVVTEFDSVSPQVFADIYELLQSSDFIAEFAGGSIARLAHGDVIEAGQISGLPQIGMLLDFEVLDQWQQQDRSVFVKVGPDLVIVDAWSANFRPLIFD